MVRQGRMGGSAALVIGLVILVGCDQRVTPPSAAASQPLPYAAATPADIPLCVLMSAAALDETAIGQAKAAAENELRSREPKMRFDFERAIAGPEDGQISLVFANLTYSDLYEVYVAQQSDGRLLRVMRTGGLYYPEGDCEGK